MIAPYKLGVRQQIRSTQVSTDSKGHYSLLFGQAQYNPNCMNKNNYSTFATMNHKEDDYRHTQYLYNHLTQTYVSADWGTNTTGDYHATPTSLFLPDGRILCFTNETHNTTISVKRSVDPFDISSYTRISEITTGSPAYMNAVIIGTRIWGCYREAFDKLRLIYSDDYGETWSTPQRVIDFDDANDWAYPRYVYVDSGDFIFACNKRETQGTDQNDYTDFYVFRTSDGVNVRNLADTVTNDLTVTGGLNDTELADYNLGNLGFVQSTQLLSSGELVIHQGQTLHYTSSGSTLSKSLTNDNYFKLGEDATSTFLKIDDNNMYLVCSVRETDGGARKLGLVYTNDFFDSTTVTELSQVEFPNTPFAASNFEITRQTIALALERKVFGSGSIIDPDNSYSDLILVDGLNL